VIQVLKDLCLLAISVSHISLFFAWMKVPMIKVRIWDLPTRLFHWLLTACVLGLVISGNLGGNAMVWHFRFGYAVLSLLIFRVVWGFLGGHWSRWSQLPLSPSNVLVYLQGRSPSLHHVGHNPLGSWSIVLILLFLGLQVGTGLFSDDEIANSGPLSSFASSAVVSLATQWHKQWGKLFLILLVSIHVLAVLWYWWRKQQSLVPAMWHGDKNLQVSVPDSQDTVRTRLIALALFGVAVVLVFALVSLAT
jgi:cytochrome b